MKKLRAIVGYAVAILTIPIVLATFVGLDEWSQGLVGLTGLKVSPWFTGGEVARYVDRGSYQVTVHKPVFMGLLHETRTGFVQVEWSPLASLPEIVRDEVDIDADGHNDFRVNLDTRSGKAAVEPLNDRVLGLETALKLQNGWMIRVKLLHGN